MRAWTGGLTAGPFNAYRSPDQPGPQGGPAYLFSLKKPERALNYFQNTHYIKLILSIFCQTVRVFLSSNLQEVKKQCMIEFPFGTK